MPFDNILQVGRTPKVTDDVIINPYSINQQNIAPALILTRTTNLGTNFTGSDYNIIDPDYPSDVIALGFLTGVKKYITGDLGKIVYVKKISLGYKITNFGGTSTNKLVIQISNDGTAWETLYDSNITADTDLITLEFNYRKFRFIKFGTDTVAGGSVTTIINFYKLKIVLDELQY